MSTVEFRNAPVAPPMAPSAHPFLRRPKQRNPELREAQDWTPIPLQAPGRYERARHCRPHRRLLRPYPTPHHSSGHSKSFRHRSASTPACGIASLAIAAASSGITYRLTRLRHGREHLRKRVGTHKLKWIRVIENRIDRQPIARHVWTVDFNCVTVTPCELAIKDSRRAKQSSGISPFQ